MQHKNHSATSSVVRPTSQSSSKSKAHVKIDTKKINQHLKQDLNDRASPNLVISQANTKNTARLITTQNDVGDFRQLKMATSKNSVTNFEVKTIKSKNKNHAV